MQDNIRKKNTARKYSALHLEYNMAAITASLPDADLTGSRPIKSARQSSPCTSRSLRASSIAKKKKHKISFLRDFQTSSEKLISASNAITPNQRFAERKRSQSRNSANITGAETLEVETVSLPFRTQLTSQWRENKPFCNTVHRYRCLEIHPNKILKEQGREKKSTKTKAEQQRSNTKWKRSAEGQCSFIPWTPV